MSNVIPRKKVVACTKKSRNGLKSHCNRFHSLISSEFKKCLTDGTKTSRKRTYHQIDEEGIIASTGCSKKTKSVQPTIQETLSLGPRKFSQLFIDEKVSTVFILLLKNCLRCNSLQKNFYVNFAGNS